MEILDDLVNRRFSLSEKINSRNKLSVLSSLTSADESVNELKRIKQNLLLKTNKNARFTINHRGSIPLSDEQVKTIVSMLPDEIINHASNSEIRKFDCSVFFVDVSGFTDLSDKYQNVDNGASKLSTVLNFYLGSMVQEILSHEGDILKYSGDAFIAIFRAENENLLQEAIRKAIDSALIIQTNCRNYETEVGVTLNVKISISGGEVVFSTIGNEKLSHYVICGEPVWQAKALQEHIQAGEVLVTPKAWFYMDEQLYTYRFNREQRFCQVYGFNDNLGAMQRQQEATIDFYEMERKMGKEWENELSSASTTLFKQSLEHIVLESPNRRDETFALRASMNKPLENRSKRLLRRFIIPPLMKSIDLNDPVEFLTEMRNVVIVFANFVIPKSTSEELIDIVDRTFIALTGIVTVHEGIVNKVSLFDKDMMFLIIFGLRGFKHELENRIALRCASEIHGTFQRWSDISTVSLGVTSGMSYCGVVGHSLRREYSVISVTVNKAARLMMAYPEIVSCDQETVLNSKLDMKHFTLLPTKLHKGLRGQVLAYEFKEIIESRSHIDAPTINNTPLLGQHNVLNLAHQLLAYSIHNQNQIAQNSLPFFPKSSCLVVKGSLQEGKTRILEEIHLRCVQHQLKCIYMTMQVKDSNKPFGFIRRVFMKLLDVKISFEQEIKKLLQTFDQGFNDCLCLFNPIFDTHFEETDLFKKHTEEDIFAMTKFLFNILCRQSIKGFWVLLVDDAENMDKESFLLLDSFFQCDSIFVFLTLGTQRKLSMELKRVLHELYVISYSLEELDVINQNALACQRLDVEALTIEFEMYLHENSNGNPGWIQTCTQSLLQSNKLRIETLPVVEARRKGFIVVQDLFNCDEGIFTQCCYEDDLLDTADCELIRVAVLVEYPLKSEFLTNTKTDRDLLIYDSLSSYEQLVCKCASVLSVVFQRDMLSNIMSNSPERMISKAIAKLFELHVFACSSAISSDFASKRKKSSDMITCNCRNPQIFQSCRDLPKYSCCARPQFQRKGFKKVVYESLTEKQRTEYHRRSLNYLHMETRKCIDCGGDKFPTLLYQDIDDKFRDGYLNAEDRSFQTMIRYFESLNFPILTPSKKNFIPKRFTKKESFNIRPIALNYLNYDFSKCECNKILHATFSDIINHCYGGHNALNLVDAKIALANICLKNENIPHAKNQVKQALEKLKTFQKDNLDKESRYSEYLYASALAVQGLCLEGMTHSNNALDFYYEACSTLKISFPRSFNLKAIFLERKFLLEIKLLARDKKVQKASRLNLLVAALTSKILSEMYKLFTKIGKSCLARLAAIWSLRQALKCDRKFDDIARCFTNVLQTVSSSKLLHYQWLTKTSLEQVSRAIFMHELDLDKLSEAVKLYKALMETHAKNYEFRCAIAFGDLAYNLSLKTKMTSFSNKIVPHLFLLKVNSKQLFEAEILINRFKQFTKSSENHEGIIWYHILCMDILLDTGYSILSYQECEDFFMEPMTVFSGVCNQDVHIRFASNLFLWNVRHQVSEMTTFWLRQLSSILKPQFTSQVDLIFTTLRLMESFALQTLEKKQEKKLREVLHIHQLMALSKKAVQKHKFLAERFKLLKIYVKSVKKRSKVPIERILKLEEKAFRNGNFLAYEIINHNRKMWSNKIPASIANFWINHSLKDDQVKFNEISSSNRVFPFSLPLPS